MGVKRDRYGNVIYDKYGNEIPIYKTIRKLKVMHIAKNKTVSFHWVKPYNNGEYWYYDLKDITYVIPDPDNMIQWMPRIGDTPIVITKWMDVELKRKPECDWIDDQLKS